ncbi:MAG TPA: hypothetical protein VFQ65_29665 [Kofleriaceae bacterium]|nr:hypothetical protein [Kofleriaceae bacterium]
MPKVGDTLNQGGGVDWPKMQWLYDAPSAKDAAGKIVIHWFCQAQVQACVDDLARVITLRDSGKVYIVAYLNAASQAEAKKLDPIRESEGVGRGTVAFGKGVTTLDKQLSITGPASLVVDVDGKVQLVSTASDATALDARDAKVNDLVKNIKDYTSQKDGPTTVKPGDKFTLSLKIQLANWLTYSGSQPKEFNLTVPKDIKCDATKLKGDQLKVDGHTLTAQVSCSGPRGSYEARGSIKFGYDSPSGAGFGNVDGVVWKFQIAQ